MPRSTPFRPADYALARDNSEPPHQVVHQPHRIRFFVFETTPAFGVAPQLGRLLRVNQRSGRVLDVMMDRADYQRALESLTLQLDNAANASERLQTLAKEASWVVDHHIEAQAYQQAKTRHDAPKRIRPGSKI